MTLVRTIIILLAATTPQTVPAGTVIDLSTPRAAARSLLLAVSTGDRDAVGATLFAGDRPQMELASATASLLISGKKLGDAAHEQFGSSGDAIGHGMIGLADLGRLDAATISQNGDLATVTVPGQNRPMNFRRQNDQWKLVTADLSAATPESIAKQTRLVRMMATAMDESARDIAAGMFKTPELAVGSIQKRLHEVMLSFDRPATTRSTTRPAGSAAPSTHPD